MTQPSQETLPRFSRFLFHLLLLSWLEFLALMQTENILSLLLMWNVLVCIQYQFAILFWWGWCWNCSHKWPKTKMLKDKSHPFLTVEIFRKWKWLRVLFLWSEWVPILMGMSYLAHPSLWCTTHSCSDRTPEVLLDVSPAGVAAWAVLFRTQVSNPSHLSHPNIPFRSASRLRSLFRDDSVEFALGVMLA